MAENLNFKAPWWLRNKHVQSIYASVIPKSAEIQLRWEELSTPDGDFIDLAWAGPIDGPIIVLLHGTEGSVNSHYIQEMMEFFIERGWQCVTMHFRTCSGRLNRKAQFYDGCDSNGDFTFLLQVLHARHPNLPIFAMGFSLGANVLVRHVAQHPEAPLRGVVAVSMPYELAKSADYLVPFYQKVLLRSMKRKMEQKLEQGMHLPIEANRLDELTSVRHFDALITAPMYDYASVDDYYEDASTRPLLKYIEHPTLVFHALDDPFVPESSLPAASELSKNITLEISQNGGHMGFLRGGLPWRPAYWLTQRIEDFLSKHVDPIHKLPL